MKRCSECNAECFDIENYCIYCGTRLAPADIRCNYCGTRVVDLKATNCDNCGAPLDIERYPSSLKLFKCKSCKQGTPAEGSLYCAHCGAYIAKPVQGKPTQSSSLNLGIIVLLSILIPLVVGAIIYFSDVQYDPDLEKLERSYKYASFDKYTVSQMASQPDNLEKYDWVEITGIITKYQNNAIHLTTNGLEDDFYVMGSPYDYTRGGRFDEDAHEIGETVTIKGYIRYLPDSVNVEIGVFEIY